jgi:C-terminal processing protease CtpA/Prc
VAASLRAAGRALVVGAKRATHDGLRPLLRLDEHTVMQVALAELLASDGTPFGAGVDPDLTVPADFSVDGEGDRELAFATQLLLHAKGTRRSDLLTASAPH